MSKIIILVSGFGGNLQAIINAVGDGSLRTEIAAVLSSNADAFALERAHAVQIPTHVVPPLAGENRYRYSERLCDVLRPYSPDLVCLAGFMKILGEPMLKAYPKRILNIHPSLLPEYPGTHAIERAWEEQPAKTGCTVHIVDAGVDTGTRVAQCEIDVLPTDTLETLTERIHAAEHHLYPIVIQQVLSALAK